MSRISLEVFCPAERVLALLQKELSLSGKVLFRVDALPRERIVDTSKGFDHNLGYTLEERKFMMQSAQFSGTIAVDGKTARWLVENELLTNMAPQTTKTQYNGWVGDVKVLYPEAVMTVDGGIAFTQGEQSVVNGMGLRPFFGYVLKGKVEDCWLISGPAVEDVSSVAFIGNVSSKEPKFNARLYSDNTRDVGVSDGGRVVSAEVRSDERAGPESERDEKPRVLLQKPDGSSVSWFLSQRAVAGDGTFVDGQLLKYIFYRLAIRELFNPSETEILIEVDEGPLGLCLRPSERTEMTERLLQTPELADLFQFLVATDDGLYIQGGLFGKPRVLAPLCTHELNESCFAFSFTILVMTSLRESIVDFLKVLRTCLDVGVIIIGDDGELTGVTANWRHESNLNVVLTFYRGKTPDGVRITSVQEWHGKVPEDGLYLVGLERGATGWNPYGVDHYVVGKAINGRLYNYFDPLGTTGLKPGVDITVSLDLPGTFCRRYQCVRLSR